MKTLQEVRKHIDSYYRPNGFSIHNWRVLKKTALIAWEYYLQGGTWNSTINISCKEFYFMLLNENSELIVEPSLLKWSTNKYNSQTWQLNLKRGIDLYNKGYYSHAMQCFNLIELMEDKSYKLYFYKSLIYSQMNAKKEALEYLSKAQNIAPDYYLTYVKQAEIYFELGAVAKAVENAKEAIHLNPTNQYAQLLFSELCKEKTMNQAA